MPRAVSSKIRELRAKAEAVENDTARETVVLDTKTFEKLVSFVEREGCTLQEALRRAVRFGLEFLCSDNVPAEAAPVNSGVVNVLTRITKDQPDTEETGAGSEEGDDERDYTKFAPPGL